MLEAIAGVLKIALGLVTNKLRSYGAEKLQDGGLTDQKFRGWIVRELDDVNFKLDALSRMHLSASVSFFKQGVERLLICFGDSFDGGNESQSSELLKDGQSSAESKSLTSVGEAVALVNVFRKLKIESKKHFESAKGLFAKSAEEATLSFHNDALKTNERIHAAEVRIASAILGNLDDLEIAVSDCLHYITELHNMTAIKEIFTVHIKGGLKALFKKDSRAEIVETITMINLILADFIMKFTKRRMGLFDWPTIKCGDDVFHPICNDESIKKMKRMEISVPWEISFSERLPGNYRLAINSKGEIYGFDIEKKDNMVKFDRAAGEWKPFNISPSNDKVRNCVALTIDDEDMIQLWNVFQKLVNVFVSAGSF
ncbi:uncharacterized protein LOC114534478 [Dendronephthya gigantea]|uniref:uncharacterized protein LOC114534478 n=1 Tax=Dendronephthya gigantea TaxID=151771 RepID=UPI00106A7B0D|nr:uncharacterized protein LOC114534478 [Dendronephthya gigantea]